MNILAVDTTTKIASVSVKKENKIFFNCINNEITHSEKLLPLIEKTLKESDLKLSNIDELALINGPGSFTGIRIGLATLKAFSHVHKMNIFSISSLELIALSYFLNKKFQDEKYIISIIDAKNDRIYYSIYKVFEKDSKLEIVSLTDIQNDMIDVALENISSKLLELEVNINDVNFAGVFSENIIEYLKNYTYSKIYPTTNDLLNIMHLIKDKEKFTYNAFNLKAIYARPSQAERVKNGEK